MIEAAGLTKRDGATAAVSGPSFTVPPGQATGRSPRGGGPPTPGVGGAAGTGPSGPGAAAVGGRTGRAGVAAGGAGGSSLAMPGRLGAPGARPGAPPVLLLDEPVNGLDPD